MKKNRQWKGFALGLITATLIFCLGTTALAATVRQLDANYSGIKITLDGLELVPKDSNGNIVEPFTVNGTTYLPVRAIADALGLGVSWDGATQTVKLTRDGSVPTQPTVPEQTAPSQSAGNVIMEQNGLKITFLGFAPKATGLKGYDIKLKIENNSGKDYTVQVRELSANGIMADSIFSCDVKAGKVANDVIWLYNLEMRGITLPITSAEFSFHIFNTNDWSDSFDSDIINIQ